MLSIIIPTLNEEKRLASLLKNIAEQTYSEPIEIVVADAGSTDDTRAVAESFKDTFAALQVVDGGLPAVGRNKGGRAAQGELLVFMDADIQLPSPLFLEENVRYFKKHNLVAASVLFRADSATLLDHVLTHLSNTAIRILKYIHPLGSMCIMVTRDVFSKTGGYPEDRIMAEDHDFIERCTRFGRFDLLPLPIIFSTRRFDEEGRVAVALKYIWVTLHIICIGPVKKPLFEYKFSHAEKPR
ncbi:glycosyltransferase [Candidatus Parcubacteria bacterium]|nr:MAG: glycosyltransferase [Candidatus Parcubacteria bacterium]